MSSVCLRGRDMGGGGTRFLAATRMECKSKGRQRAHTDWYVAGVFPDCREDATILGVKYAKRVPPYQKSPV